MWEGSVIFNVFDPKTFKPILNTSKPYGAAPACDAVCAVTISNTLQTAAGRKNAMDFMDNYVQNGYYVVVRKNYNIGNIDWAPTVWAKRYIAVWFREFSVPSLEITGCTGRFIHISTYFHCCF